MSYASNIVDVAQRAGVSVMTVSRLCNGPAELVPASRGSFEARRDC